MFRRMAVALLLLGCLFLPGRVLAQQAQTSTAPLQALNAKYNQGVGTGYWPTAGSGLTLNIAGGTVNCAGAPTTYSASTLSMTASTTNYVYLNTASSCVPAVKTTSFTASDIMIAEVGTSGSAITSITDYRTMFTTPGACPTCNTNAVNFVAGDLVEASGNHTTEDSEVATTSLETFAANHGTSRTMAGFSEIYVCTSTCTFTPPSSATEGQQFCVQNDDNVSTVITIAAVSGVQYEATARTSYGTANHTTTSGGAVGDQICFVARSATKWNVWGYIGTWTNN